VLVFPESSLIKTLDRVERLRQLVKTMPTGHVHGSLSPSAGVVEAKQYSFDLRDMLRAADEALYAAKRAGRDRVMIGPSTEPKP